MSKLTAVVLTAAICLPVGALLQRDAAAERRGNPIGIVGTTTRPIVGHPDLSRARAALHEALTHLEASQRRDEGLWSDRTGRATATKAALERAVRVMDRSADWVNDGMSVSAANAVPLY